MFRRASTRFFRQIVRGSEIRRIPVLRQCNAINDSSDNESEHPIMLRGSIDIMRKSMCVRDPTSLLDQFPNKFVDKK